MSARPALLFLVSLITETSLFYGDLLRVSFFIVFVSRAEQMVLMVDL